ADFRHSKHQLEFAVPRPPSNTYRGRAARCWPCRPRQRRRSGRRGRAAGNRSGERSHLQVDFRQLDALRNAAAVGRLRSRADACQERAQHLYFRHPFGPVQGHGRDAFGHRPRRPARHADLRHRRRDGEPRHRRRRLRQPHRIEPWAGHPDPLRPPVLHDGARRPAREARPVDRADGLHRPLHRQPPPLRSPHRRRGGEPHRIHAGGRPRSDRPAGARPGAVRPAGDGRPGRRGPAL
ncbi:MAG: Peptidase, M23/M37 family, partial [uncultured Sphingomonadaceae bacterium]